MAKPIDPLKNVQNAWIDMLFKFRSWYFPETAQTKEWKFRAAEHAIKSCRSNLMDDSEGMLVAYRKNGNDAQVDEGTSAYIPVVLTATAMVDMPPDAGQLVGAPYSTEVIIAERIAKVRVIPTAIRAQFAFYATNPHDARSVCGQLCTYLTNDWKRKIDVPFVLGFNADGTDITDKFKFIVFDNNLMPSPIPSEATNLSIFTVDVTLVGYVPQVFGLGLDGENDVDHGYDEDGTPITNIDHLNDLVVIQADQFDGEHTRVLADRDTGEITVEKIDD